MSHELLYTSAPQGLKPGSRGFCTVEMTDGIPPGLVDRLESLSGYRQAFPIHDPRAKLNPVNFSHLIVPAGGRQFHVLSRIADAGQDYTGRSNKLAHHVALEAAERPAGNPAWVLRSAGFCQTSWDGATRTLPSGRRPPSGTRGPAMCRAWQEAAGHAGWAGVLIAAAVEAGARPVSVIYPAGMDVLPLVEEALALVPGERQWDVTFSTYFTKLPAGIDCQWRFVLEDTPEAHALRRNVHAEVIDLTRSPGRPPSTEYAKWAVSGRPPSGSRRLSTVNPASALAVSMPVERPPAAARHEARVLVEAAPAPVRSLASGVPVASPPPLATAVAHVPPPPRHGQPPPIEAAESDSGYSLSTRPPPPRSLSPGLMSGDPRAVRSLEALLSGQDEPRERDSRWVAYAAIGLAAVVLVAVTAFLLGRGSIGSGQSASRRPEPAQPPADRIARSERSTQPRQEAAANPRRRAQAAGTSSESAGPVAPSRTRENPPTGAPLGGAPVNPRPGAATNPSVPLGPARPDGSVPRSNTPNDLRPPPAAPGNGAAHREKAGTLPGLTVHQPVERQPEPTVTRLTGFARMALGNESERSSGDPGDDDRRVAPGEWLEVPDGKQAEILIEGGFGRFVFRITGGTVVAFDQPENAFQHAIVLNICPGRVDVLIDGKNQNVPKLGVRACERPQARGTLKSARPDTLVLPRGEYSVEIEAEAGGQRPEIGVRSANPKVTWRGKPVSAPE